jgi:hypothetical protein
LTRTTFIKQYGEKRTGTNLLRAVLASHFKNVRVLIHVLGDKHSGPAPFTEILRQVQESAADIGEFSTRCTLERPACTTQGDDRDQSALLSCLGASIAESYRRKELLFLISIKHPYSWFASVRRFARLDAASPAPTARQACERFNRNYRSWMELKTDYGQRVAVVRYEDLLIDADRASAQLASQFGLRRRTAGRITLPNEIIVPTYWDHMTTRAAPGERFNADYYTSDSYMSELSAEDLRTLSKMIDWDQLTDVGYSPEARQ